MVHLDVHRVPAIGETLDQVHLPQRPLPVQRGRVEPGHQRPQLRHPGGPRQRRILHVVVEVDLAAGVPAPLAQRRHRPAGPLAPHAGHLVAGDGCGEHLTHIRSAGALRRGEQRQAAHLHLTILGLRQQEQRIGRGHGNQHQVTNSKHSTGADDGARTGCARAPVRLGESCRSGAQIPRWSRWQTFSLQ